MRQVLLTGNLSESGGSFDDPRHRAEGRHEDHTRMDQGSCDTEGRVHQGAAGSDRRPVAAGSRMAGSGDRPRDLRGAAPNFRASDRGRKSAEAPVAKPAALELALAKFQRRAQQAQERLAPEVSREAPESAAAVAPPPLAAAVESAPPPGPQENPGEAARLALTWTTRRMGRSIVWISNSIGGEHWTIEPRRFSEDEPVEYFAGRVGRLGFESIGGDAFASRDLAESACERDAMRRNGGT